MNVTAMRRDGAPSSGHAARLAIPAGHRGSAAGLAPCFVQSFPPRWRAIFAVLTLNPKPYPLIGPWPRGDIRAPEFGEDLDIRIDLPRYRVWRNSNLVAVSEDVRHFWPDDLVSFVIGCSSSFEEALIAETSNCVTARPAATCRCTGAHRQAGVNRHCRRDELRLRRRGAGQRRRVAVFWAYGVTPQSVIATMRPEFCITHYPGSTLVTDRKHSENSRRSDPLT
jgi:uncharacterized protein YcsI (UPF0317 family)